MKKLYFSFLTLASIAAFAQNPTHLGTNLADGTTYVGTDMIDHGAVRSLRIQATNSIAANDGTWEFYTGNYSDNWRPYTADQTLVGFNTIIDPATEPASARYNSNFGGQIGKLPEVTAGNWYTFIVGDLPGQNNRMNVVETTFEPVGITNVAQLPVAPSAGQAVTVSVEISAAQPSVGEHVFIRWSTDGFANSTFTEVTGWSGNIGTATIPGQAGGATVVYYALATTQAAPDASTIDYFTLFFGNNNGQNYTYAVPEPAATPLNLGTNLADGITYSTYPLTTYGVVNMGRMMAQNSLNAGEGNWEFFYGNYFYNWRPYDGGQTLSGYDAIIDPTTETASARYNNNFGGQTGLLPAIQAGNWYTFIVQNGELDNFMSVLETTYQPADITNVGQSPAQPTNVDAVSIPVTFSVQNLNPDEYAFVRYTTDGWATSTLVPVTGISGGTGTATIPALPANTVVEYYALTSEQSAPVVATVDYFTLSFGNNNNLNYTYTVDLFVGVNAPASGLRVVPQPGTVRISGFDGTATLQLLALDGRVVAATSTTGGQATLSTEGLAKGVYVVRVQNGTETFNQKVLVQ